MTRWLISLVCVTVFIACDAGGGAPRSEVAVPTSPISGETPRPEKTEERVNKCRDHDGRQQQEGGPTVELWYALTTESGIGWSLVAVQRQIPDVPAVADATLRAWIEGPTCAEQEAGIFSLVPRGTRLHGVSIAEGAAVVDLSSGFERTQLGTLYEGLLLQQLAWTITQFPSVERALLKIDGRFKDYYMGHGYIIDETHPLARN